MSKKLLREYYELCDGGVCQDLLTEAEKQYVRDGGMMLSGMMQMAETQNGNGRVYPRNILEREVKNYAKLVKENRALGELDHPEDSVINLKNVSHQITEIWMDDDKVMGKMKVLGTPSGNILKELVNSGVSIGIIILFNGCRTLMLTFFLNARTIDDACWAICICSSRSLLIRAGFDFGKSAKCTEIC